MKLGCKSHTLDGGPTYQINRTTIRSLIEFVHAVIIVLIIVLIII